MLRSPMHWPTWVLRATLALRALARRACRTARWGSEHGFDIPFDGGARIFRMNFDALSEVLIVDRVEDLEDLVLLRLVL